MPSLEDETPELVILSGPHGAGKDHVLDLLASRSERFRRIARHTTRLAGSGETDGSTYHFVTPDEFQKLESGGDFIESNHYPEASTGTSAKEVRGALAGGKTGIVVLNPTDAELVLAWANGERVTALPIFVGPVSLEIFLRGDDEYLRELESRMTARNRPSDDIALRLQRAAEYRMRQLTDLNFHYVENSRGRSDSAADAVMQLAIATPGAQ